MTGLWLRVLTGALLTAASLVAAAAPATADHAAGAVAPYGFACPDGEVPEDGFLDVPPTNVHETAIDCAV